MLPPLTRQYHDRSTDGYFAFTFFCDSCGAPWHSEEYPFSLRDDPPRSETEKTARELIWKAEHDAAYERANNEAIFHFNKCPRCAKRICDNCFSPFEDVCTDCARDETKRHCG